MKMNELAHAHPTLLGIPAGKSLETGTLDMLSQAHITVRRGHERSCTAKIEGFPGIQQAVFIKPSQIPALVADGAVPIALTGEDTVIESGADVETLTTRSFSKATAGGTRCVLFAREGFDADILEGGPQRQRERSITVISEYPKETRLFLENHGVNAEVVPCSGSAEALVVIKKYDYGVALTETGTSLQVNRLKEVETIFTSKTVLIANKAAMQNGVIRERATFLASLLAGVLEARDKVYITMNARINSLGAIKNILPSLKSPTVQQLAEEGFCAISSVVPVEGLVELKFCLKALGAEGIVEFNHSSIV